MGIDPVDPKGSLRKHGYDTSAHGADRLVLGESHKFYPYHQGGGPTDAIGSKAHGFRHAAHKRSGYLRNSGMKGAHRLGRRGS